MGRNLIPVTSIRSAGIKSPFFLESLNLWTSCRVNFSQFVESFGAKFVKVSRRNLFFAFFLSFYSSKGKLWTSWRLLAIFFDFLTLFFSIVLQLNCSFVVNSSFENLAVSEAIFGKFRWLVRKLNASFSSTCDFFEVFDFSFFGRFSFLLFAVLFESSSLVFPFWRQYCWKGFFLEPSLCVPLAR